jgi:hypothetical protein
MDQSKVMTQAVCEGCGLSKDTGECVCDINIDFGAPEQPVESHVDLPPELSDLTEDEKALLKKVQEKQAQIDPIMGGFKLLTNKPTEEQIEVWRKTYGKVFTIGLDEDEYYIFRPLRRIEWRSLMQALSKQPDELKRKEAIVQRAVLWPALTPDKVSGVSAGTPETLYEMILQCSNFLLPQEAMQCVRKL